VQRIQLLILLPVCNKDVACTGVECRDIVQYVKREFSESRLDTPESTFKHLPVQCKEWTQACACTFSSLMNICDLYKNHTIIQSDTKF
jgi:hypothetical protein